MKRYASKVTKKGRKAVPFETVNEAYLYALSTDGGTVWKAMSKTKGGGWTKVATVNAC